MKKLVPAVALGAVLVAGQAFAAGQAASVSRVGDRVGPIAEDSSEFAGIPLFGIVAAAGVVAAAVAIVAGSDDSDSD